ncbi:GNAT family N-acetyltransferase [Paenibacillus sp. SN-8-1]|uniref:GNAT family N-acetyltransferase n=1 Tax=Paenibacillus sp. SN-8-1 TaxID=3435409 RepID=UPI003D9AACA4
MNSLEIKKLERFTIDDQKLLGRFGYSSAYKYKVTRDLSDQKTIISIELVRLETEYVKVYPEEMDDFERYKKLISHDLSLGIFRNRELIGVAICEPYYWNKTLFIWNFHVSERYQRCGVGVSLMQGLEELARLKGFRAVGLETQNTNVPAVNFYKKCGFEIEGIDLSYYTNDDVEDGEVAFFMRKKII